LLIKMFSPLFTASFNHYWPKLASINVLAVSSSSKKYSFDQSY